MKFLWRKGNVQKKTPKEMRAIFRRVFGSADGQEVLRTLLNDWSVFDVCETEQQRALCDYGKVFLNDYLGCNGVQVYVELDTNKDEE